jgi:hypothetical protein
MLDHGHQFFFFLSQSLIYGVTIDNEMTWRTNVFVAFVVEWRIDIILSMIRSIKFKANQMWVVHLIDRSQVHPVSLLLLDMALKRKFFFG